jgi:hypothetical protein
VHLKLLLSVSIWYGGRWRLCWTIQGVKDQAVQTLDFIGIWLGERHARRIWPDGLNRTRCTPLTGSIVIHYREGRAYQAYILRRLQSVIGGDHTQLILLPSECRNKNKKLWITPAWWQASSFARYRTQPSKRLPSAWSWACTCSPFKGAHHPVSPHLGFSLCLWNNFCEMSMRKMQHALGLAMPEGYG